MKSKLFILITVLMVIFSLEVKAGKFTDNGDGTVTDNITGLMWQQGPSNREVFGQTWKEAIPYCEDLSLAGHDDWRLPNIKELTNLMEIKLDNPSVYMRSFPNTWLHEYWTSTTERGKGPNKWKFVWIVDFTRGNKMCVVVDERSENVRWRYWTRCVRQDN